MSIKWPKPFPVLLLTLMWLLLNNTLSLGHVLLGLGLSIIICMLCRDFLVEPPRLKRPFLLFTFVIKVFFDVVLANLHVARLVLGPQKNLHPGFVEVPMCIKDEFVLATLACVVSLTPGTVSAGLSADHTKLLIHALDVSQPEALISDIKVRYEAPLMEIFQCSAT